MNTPANSTGAIRKMEDGLAAMEDALKNHSLDADAEFMLGVEGGQRVYDLLSVAIQDLRTAITYAQSGVLCPDCMTVNSAGSAYCCSCGLVFG